MEAYRSIQTPCNGCSASSCMEGKCWLHAGPALILLFSSYHGSNLTLCDAVFSYLNIGENKHLSKYFGSL